MSPLERAARALCRLDGHPENATMEGRPLWQDYLPEVRAVIQAIRDPSHEMVQAVPSDTNAPIYPEDIWQAMIDAALE